MTGGVPKGTSAIFDRPLQIIRYIATRSGDADRGPCVWINGEEARRRIMLDGELVWIYGPRRHDLAPVSIDDTLPNGSAVVRDVTGVAVSEVIRLVKPDFDKRPTPGAFA
jgi:anaerobic selenocysteine-containing dehydrogenase